MYGFSKEQWKYIAENIDFTEVFIPSKGGYDKVKKRKGLWEGRGYSVIPYEDKGVSVGLYVMMRGGVKSYGEKQYWKGGD